MTQGTHFRTNTHQEEFEISHIDTLSKHDDVEHIVQQHFAKQNDINELARRMGWTDYSQLPAFADPRFYGDFSEMPKDIHEIHERMQKAETEFMRLPAHIRTQFNNDYTRFVPWVQDPKNAEAAMDMGLLKRVRSATKPEPGSASTAEKKDSGSAPASAGANTAT